MNETPAEIEFRTTLATTLVNYAGISRLFRDAASLLGSELADFHEPSVLALTAALDDECSVRWKAYMAYMMARCGIDVSISFNPESAMEDVLAAVARTESGDHEPGALEELTTKTMAGLRELAERMGADLPEDF